jgi:hypothetical protein
LCGAHAVDAGKQGDGFGQRRRGAQGPCLFVMALLQ